MAVTDSPGGIGITLDSTEWWKVSTELKKYDPALLTALRKRLRNAGNFAVEEIRRTLGMPSPDGGPDTGEQRARLAAATKVTISFSRRQAGAKVVTSGSKLPPEHQGVLRVYNKETFRHPVFGDKDDWVQQRGRPYFGEAFTEAVVARARQEITDAMNDASAILRS